MIRILTTAGSWLLGPIALHELVHTTRRSHFVLYRLYAYFILILLVLCYWFWALNEGPNREQHSWWDTKASAPEMANFSAEFVLTFMGLQVLLLSVLTPAYLAGVLAEEKDRGTLEFLLATDLRNREIVLSKLIARLGNLLLTLLTGLPVVAFLEILGDMDPWLILAGFAATGITMIGLAGLSILNSVYARKPRNAIVMTLLVFSAYLLISGFLPHLLAGYWIFYATPPGFDHWTLGDLVAVLETGNPVMMVIALTRELASGTSAADCIPARLYDYALFHGVLFVVCIAWASARLRAVFRKQVYEQARSTGLARRRPGVGRWPMVWKEVFVEPGLHFQWFGWLVIGVLVIGSLVPIFVEWGTPRWMGLWIRVVGGLVACLLLLHVAVHASTALTAERERQTLDGLLSTPLDARAILLGKWLGSVASVRWGWLWLGAIWGIGVAVRTLHPLSVLLMLLAWMIHAAVLAVVGLWFSFKSPSSLRATVLTILVALGLGFSYTVSLPGTMMMAAATVESDPFLLLLSRFQQGISPLISQASLLPFSARGWGRKAGWELPAALIGLACWVVGGLVLWWLLERSFRRETGRQLVRYPAREYEMLNHKVHKEHKVAKGN